jgi:c-di-GMP-binding flagellar brake protein YcgR
MDTVASIDEILAKLNDSAPTVVDIPGNQDEVYRCNALLVKKEAPCLELLFPPNAWQIDELQIGANCALAVEHKELTVNLIARLDGANGDRRLLFTAREPITPESLRDFFRVGINTAIEAQYIAGSREINNRSWKLCGTTIDLSGSGVLALFQEKPPSNRNIQLTITVPEEQQSILCLANVVRTYRVRKNRYQVAFHFENISARTRDQLISCCFQEQRRQLRENIRTL